MNHLRTVVWTPYTDPGHDYCTLSENAGGFCLEGVIAARYEYAPLRVEYRVETNHQWHTREVDVQIWQGRDHLRLQLRVDDDQRWWQGPQELEGYRGHVDVDLSLTPATNTLPIRRFVLPSGESATTTTVWVQLPRLTLASLPQHYTHLGGNDYLFAIPDSKFQARLQVDDLGLVTDYTDGWQAIAQTD